MFFLEEEKELSLKLFIVLSRAYESIITHIEKDIRSYGLNSTEFGVLELLFHKGEQPLQKIGEKILITSGSITYVVDKLQNKGLLQRINCPEDRRITYAHLTKQGKELMETIFPAHLEKIHQVLGGLDAEEKELAITHLKKLGLFAKNQK
ncbi:MarR family transcriptional regulator [Alkalihalobacillus sp. LMS39]|uniref:MarR family winged helix-turn-helix transcriptional regulator n=1 Tax=Alkalihalobacillus sp. LMS39 TaxID=2924032 RepID=UPI001FB2DC0A|nr:MarR family transcriptional regulator [Alkalihalobacillus sp. LMS39]UOE96369.1 MarR family transcriptional regulator [Alkalihalobacillus sp. LMS39]